MRCIAGQVGCVEIVRKEEGSEQQYDGSDECEVFKFMDSLCDGCLWFEQDTSLCECGFRDLAAR